MNRDITGTEDNIDVIYLNIIKSIKEAFESLTVYKTKYYKNNEWWSQELKDIKNEILSIKKKFKNYNYRTTRNVTYNEEDKSKLKELKRLFRNQQRINKRNKDSNKYRFLEKLSKNKNDKRFWYNMRKFNNGEK
jgi:hypothetical protein